MSKKNMEIKEKKQEKDIEFEIKNPETLILSLILIALFFFQVQVTLRNPFAFGDEGYHGMLQRYIGTAKDYPKWHPYYSNPLGEMGVSDNPLWHLLGGSMFMIFGTDMAIKILVPFIGVICVGFATYFLTKQLFENKVIAFTAAIIAVTAPSVVTYSVLNYKDAMMTFYFTVFVFTSILAIKTKDQKYWIITGIMGGLLILGKTSGFAMVPALAGLFFLYRLYEERKPLKVIKEFLPLIIIIALITGTYFLRNLAFYKTPLCEGFIRIFNTEGCNLTRVKYESQYKFEGRTVEAGTEATPAKIGFTNYLDFAYGNLWLLPFFFTLGVFYSVYKKDKVYTMLILTILSFLPIYYIAFRARAEDTARWLMPLVPTMAVIASIYLSEIYEFMKKHLKTIALVFFIFILFFSYRNFNQKLQIKNQVKQFSPAFLQACEWVKQNTPKDARFGAIVYMPAAGYNCDRNIAGGGPEVVLSQNKTLALSVLHMQNVSYLMIQKTI
ncbi:MAG: glycosyltransferase family 39 protein, partial [Fervidobacterium sp.]